MLYQYECKRDEGMRETLRAIELNPNNQNAQHGYAMQLGGFVNANLGFLLYRAGYVEEAVIRPRHTVAMNYLELAIDERAIVAIWLKWERHWGPLRGHPRFPASLAWTGLSQP